MISKRDYEEALQIVKTYESEKKNKGFATITVDGDFVDRIPFTNPKEDLDEYLNILLKGEKGSFEKLQELKNWKITANGDKFTLPFYSKSLYNKWFNNI
jgi:hypothetical protein